ncbi:response regulator [Neobacillus terrae]|uniref:response regulator n=1 Tax=Neobacillus terrae TaxID=3034837 RepID=UPI00140BAB7C|nr:response regulator [Neobacillus terrae]
MSFKKKQIIGFGAILLLIVSLMAGIFYMINSMKNNMQDIMDDRYTKVNLATDMRQLFFQSDRELLSMTVSNDEQEIKESNKILNTNHTILLEDISTLTGIVNRQKSRYLLSRIEESYRSYTETETQVKEAIKRGDKTALRPLLVVQNERRTEVIKNLNGFKNFQESLMKSSLKSAKNTYQDAINTLITGLLLALIATAVIGYWVIRSTANNLRAITKVIKTLNYKDLSVLPRIRVKTKDEIGDIASAFNEMAGSLENYSFKEKEFTSKIEEQNWIQTRLADLATMYQRIVSMDILAGRFLTSLAPMLDAAYGAFYAKVGEGEKTRFRKLASFAGSDGEAGRHEFLPGEGLIGQAAIEKRAHLIEDIPEGYRLITSGLGVVRPKSILIAPVLFEDEAVAMIEIASLEAFDEKKRKFLTQALETLGITINSVKGRMEIERLLKESQAQTEELQVQSEELQSQSEELQAQAEEMQSQSEELRMINEQLAERNLESEQKTRELQKVKINLEKQAEQLKLSSRYKSEFLANMSHELRTPLNSILILSEMLSDGTEETLSEEQKEFARVINSSGQDLLSLINDILDLSKVEVGKLDMVFGEMNLSELPGILERNFTHLAKSRGIQFNIVKDEKTPGIFYTDEQRFQQIIKNLLSNAFKFTESGSVSVNIGIPSPETMKKANFSYIDVDWLEITVEDTGIGIPEDKQEIIFEAFKQVDGATMRKFGGTGLGLAICKEFAALLGGWIEVDSKEGKGSKFTLYIPSLPAGLTMQEATLIASEEVAAAMPVETESEPVIQEKDIPINPSGAGSNHLQNKKVLVVDDDNRNIFALEKALAHEGMHISTAHNGHECLDILNKGKEFDIVLMDIMMPGLDGYETMRQIRTEKKYDDLPIVALTAKAMKGDREKCLEAGASDYISKPIKMDQLLSVLRVWLSNPSKN